MLSAAVGEGGYAQYAKVPCASSSGFVPSSLLVAILSSPATIERRLPALLETWVPRFEAAGAKVIVLSHGAAGRSGADGGLSADPRVVPLETDLGPGGCGLYPDGRCHAGFKEQVRAMLQHSRGEGIVLRVDDDTVVHPQRLLAVLRCLPAGEPFLLGRVGDWLSQPFPFAEGGAGFALPARLLPEMLAAADVLENATSKADDMLYALTAQRLGAVLVKHDGFFQAWRLSIIFVGRRAYVVPRSGPFPYVSFRFDASPSPSRAGAGRYL